MADKLLPVLENRKTQFVTVFFSQRPEEMLHNFRCTNCGRMLFKYSGDLETMIFDGGPLPDAYSHEEVMCGRCALTFLVVKIPGAIVMVK